MDDVDSKQPHNCVELRAFDNETHDLDFNQRAAKTWATHHDVQDMDALGLTPTFKRRFEFVSMLDFSSIVVVGWQATVAMIYFGLYNGGTGGLFWGFIYSILGMTFVHLSLAELSSSFPTAGGQFQWVAECAPPSMRKVLAYTTGWLLTLSWVAYLAACGTIIGNWITYCISVYRPDLPAANSQWFPSTIGIAILFGGAAFNIYLAKQLPAIEGVMLSIHLAGWVAVMITLWVMSPRGTVADVIFTFSNPAGWPNAGVASLIGVITPWGSMIGYDSSVHMTENVKDASRTIPLSLLSAYALNAALAFIVGVTMTFCLGDIDSVLESFSPSMQVFLNSTGSKTGSVLLAIPVILSFMSALVSEVATASRQLRSFARDGGLPAGHLLEPVPDAETPRRAVWTTVSLTSCIVCINIGTTVGFNAITSLVICALTFSYSITIACTIWRRYYGRALPRERFSLGRAGGPINVAALCFALPVTVISVFPPEPHPTPAYMNWAIVVFGVVTVVALVNYVFSGRYNFKPPIRKEA